MGGGQGGDGGGGGGIMNLLMLNPRFRQMMQMQQQQQLFQQQQAARRGMGEIMMANAGNQGAGTPIGPGGLYTGTPGQNTPPPGWQPPGIQGPQGGPQQPPGLPPPPGQQSQPPQPRPGANASVADTEAWQKQYEQPRGGDGMSQGPRPPLMNVGIQAQGPSGGPQTGSIGSTFNPMAGTPGQGNGMSWDQFKPIMQRRESAGGKNVPNYMFDRGHTASGVNQITASTWNRYAPALGIEKASYERPAMSFSQEEQDAVGKAIFEKEGAAPWANYDKPLRNDLTKSGINPGIPEGKVAADQAQMRQLDWRAATRAYMAIHPNAKPEDVADAVSGMLPFMNQDSQAQWKTINEQLAAARLEESRSHHEKTEGQGDKRLQQGDEKLDIQRQKLTDARTHSEKRLKQLDDQLVLANKKLNEATDYHSRLLATQNRRALEQERHNAEQEVTSATNALANLGRVPGVDITTPDSEGTPGMFGKPGFKATPEVAGAKEQVARARSRLNPRGALTKPTGKTPAETINKKPISTDSQAKIKALLASQPEKRDEILKDLEAQGFDISGL